jgi:hypothetical protein
MIDCQKFTKIYKMILEKSLIITEVQLVVEI